MLLEVFLFITLGYFFFISSYIYICIRVFNKRSVFFFGFYRRSSTDSRGAASEALKTWNALMIGRGRGASLGAIDIALTHIVHFDDLRPVHIFMTCTDISWLLILLITVNIPTSSSCFHLMTSLSRVYFRSTQPNKEYNACIGLPILYINKNNAVGINDARNDKSIIIHLT